MIILGLETARDACSAALEVDGVVRASRTLLRPRKHAELLIPIVHEVMSRSGMPFNRIEAVAVSAGPGSYTGLRIGVSAAKGMCLALGSKLVGVSTPAAYARAVRDRAAIDGWSPDVIAIALTSRRGEVYFDAFEGPDLSPMRASAVVYESEAAKWLMSQSDKSVAAGGDGIGAILARFESGLSVTHVPFIPQASYVTDMGRHALMRGDEDDLDRFEPYYLKDYVAKRPSGTVFDRLQI